MFLSSHHSFKCSVPTVSLPHSQWLWMHSSGRNDFFTAFISNDVAAATVVTTDATNKRSKLRTITQWHTPARRRRQHLTSAFAAYACLSHQVSVSYVFLLKFHHISLLPNYTLVILFLDHETSLLTCHGNLSDGFRCFLVTASGFNK